jgi:undecaprenyl diphosphate synthase
MNSKIDSKKLPQHIAIIMDGNRRWATSRGLSPDEGHQAGAKNLEEIVDYCQKIGIRYLTVYALSTENWRKRSPKEVKGIFDLLIKIVKEKKEKYQKSGIRFSVIGDFQAFPLNVKKAIKKILSLVLKKETLKFNVALNYGGRDEIVNAVKNIIKDGIKPAQVNEKLISQYLYTKDQPDPDLIIRPGGEHRLSNFLLWQLSYAELYFTDTLWPDFGPKKLDQAIIYYQKSDRRLGK